MTRTLPPPGRERDEAIATAIGLQPETAKLFNWSTENAEAVELLTEAKRRGWESTQHLIYPRHSPDGWFEQYFDVGGYAYKHESAALADAMSGAFLLACWAEEGVTQ